MELGVLDVELGVLDVELGVLDVELGVGSNPIFVYPLIWPK